MDLAGFKRTVVHLGNASLADASRFSKTINYAKRFPNTLFIGIDTVKPESSPLLQNWSQRTDDFILGLNRLEDKSVDLISSEMSFGHYPSTAPVNGYYPVAPANYTKRGLSAMYRKLKPGGKILITLAGEAIGRFRQVVAESEFKDFIETIPKRNRLTWTFWTKESQKQGVPVSVFSATKPRQ
jgi:SAM-dependent methyltransferase